MVYSYNGIKWVDKLFVNILGIVSITYYLLFVSNTLKMEKPFLAQKPYKIRLRPFAHGCSMPYSKENEQTTVMCNNLGKCHKNVEQRQFRHKRMSTV